MSDAIALQVRLPKQALLVINFDGDKFYAWYNGVELSTVAVEELTLSERVSGLIEVKLVMQGVIVQERGAA